jgi:hypothetical protein
MRTGSSVRPSSSASTLPLELSSSSGLLLVLLALHDVDPHLRERGHDVLDLVVGEFVLRQRLVELVHRDEAALLAASEQFLEIGVERVEQRAVAAFLACRLLALLRRLGRHVPVLQFDYAVFPARRVRRRVRKPPVRRKFDRALY